MLSPIKNCVRGFCKFKNVFKVCVIGAGPAGFYAAQHFVKYLQGVNVDIYEKLPVPFGLVRFGVAPDHPEVKNVINTFSKTAEHPNVDYYGNVNLGTDIKLEELLSAYHIVLLAYGADQNKKLNIPGEDLDNSLSARDIVGWYNGFPSNSHLKIDLNSPKVTIFGQGNVAIDVARILLSPVKLLRNTDITDYALEILERSKVEEVQLIGRRGPLQAAFTIKELREILKLENCKPVWNADDFKNIPDLVPTLARPKRRITELMLQYLRTEKQGGKILKPKFFRAPKEIYGSNKVEGVKLSVTKLTGEDVLNQSAILTDDSEIIDCNLAVSSIGYKSCQVDSNVPFENDLGRARHVNGKISEGLYAAGWLATGPVGVLLTTMNNAFVTSDNIIRDLKSNDLLHVVKGGSEVVLETLRKRNVQIVTWDDWLKIDKYEQDEGKKLGKPRNKLVDIKKMLEIAS